MNDHTHHHDSDDTIHSPMNPPTGGLIRIRRLDSSIQKAYWMVMVVMISAGWPLITNGL